MSACSKVTFLTGVKKLYLFFKKKVKLEDPLVEN